MYLIHFAPLGMGHQQMVGTRSRCRSMPARVLQDAGLETTWRRQLAAMGQPSLVQTGGACPIAFVNADLLDDRIAVQQVSLNLLFPGVRF